MLFNRPDTSKVPLLVGAFTLRVIHVPWTHTKLWRLDRNTAALSLQ